MRCVEREHVRMSRGVARRCRSAFGDGDKAISLGRGRTNSQHAACVASGDASLHSGACSISLPGQAVGKRFRCAWLQVQILCSLSIRCAHHVRTCC